jgi:hypothetical protein
MLVKQVLATVLSGSLLIASAPAGFADQTNQPTNQSSILVVKQTPEQLQLTRHKLSKPIAGCRPTRTFRGSNWQTKLISNPGIPV